MPALGFDGGFFNVEFFVPEDGPARIIEVNGRIASQFWPLVQAVLGRSTYEAMFKLACGEDPGWVRGRVEGVALSYCLRVFEDAYVESVPESEDDEFELLVRPGLRLSQQGVNDTCSYRLCIFPSFGATREDAFERRQGACRRPRVRPLAGDRCGVGARRPSPRRSARLASPSQPRSGARPRPS